MSPLTADPDALRRRFAEADHAQFMQSEDEVWDALRMEQENMSDDAEYQAEFEKFQSRLRNEYAAGILAGRQQQREIDAAVCRERAKALEAQRFGALVGTVMLPMELAKEAEACAAAIEAGPLT